MKAILSFLLLLLVVFLIGVVCLGIIMGWAVGVGWVLTQILPFTLFEGTLLTLIASIVVGFGIAKVFTMGPPWSSPIVPEPYSEPDPIPANRFYKSEDEKTNEAWFRYEMANSIYWDFDADDSINVTMNDVEMKELAIRLSELLVNALKETKLKQGQRVRVTATQLKRQMDKMNLRPYDDDIIVTAVSAINGLFDYDAELGKIVREQNWNELAEE